MKELLTKWHRDAIDKARNAETEMEYEKYAAEARAYMRVLVTLNSKKKEERWHL